MNVRQQKFVEGILAGKPASQAYIGAGYKARGNAAEVNAGRLLRNAQVAAVIDEARLKAAARFDATAERVVREMARIAFADVRRLYRPDGTMIPPHEWDEDTAAAIAGVESEEEVTTGDDGTRTVTVARKVRRWDKRAALETLFKYLGLLKDRVEMSGPGGAEIVVKVLGPGQSMEDL